MADALQSYPVQLSGGLIRDMDPVMQATQAPGSAIRLVNFEPGLSSGYRRLSGYTKWDEDTVPGSGDILGVFVFQDVVIAARGSEVYESDGTGWDTINGSDSRPGAGRYRADRYNWGTETIIFVDGVNQPATWDGTTWTEITDTDVAGASSVADYKGHMFYGVGNSLIWSGANDPDDFDPNNGAGELNVGYEILNIKVWRDRLVVYGQLNIGEFTGSIFGPDGDAAFRPVTDNVGCVSGDTLVEINGDHIYLAQDGLRPYSGTARIGDTELASVSKPIQSIARRLSRAYASGILSACSVRQKSQYRLFFSLSSVEREDTYGILGAIKQAGDAQGWEWAQTNGIRAVCADSYYNSTNEEVVVHADYDGYVYRQEVGNTFDGEPVPFIFQTPHWGPVDYRIRKTGYRVSIYSELEATGVTMNMALIYDFNERGVVQPNSVPVQSDLNDITLYNDAAVYDSTYTYDTIIEPLTKVPVNGSGMTVSLLFTGQSDIAPFSIKSIIFQFFQRGYR